MTYWGFHFFSRGGKGGWVGGWVLVKGFFPRKHVTSYQVGFRRFMLSMVVLLFGCCCAVLWYTQQRLFTVYYAFCCFSLAWALMAVKHVRLDQRRDVFFWWEEGTGDTVLVAPGVLSSGFVWAGRLFSLVFSLLSRSFTPSLPLLVADDDLAV